MDERQRIELLRIARDAIADELRDRRTPCTCNVPMPDPTGGAFVTIRVATRLRGCMGTFSPKPTLAATVESVARLACRDPRFTNDPLTGSEFNNARVEVSVLSALQETDAPETLRVGEHGVYIRRGETTGCFLPKVATEFGFSATEFLERCCTSKAALPADAWRQPDTAVYLFTAEVIEE